MMFWSQMTAAAGQGVLLSRYSSDSRMAWKPQPALLWPYKPSGHLSRNQVLLCWLLTSIFFLLFVDVFAVVAKLSVVLRCADPFHFSHEGSVLWIEQEVVMQSLRKDKNCVISSRRQWFARACSVFLYSGENRNPLTLLIGVQCLMSLSAFGRDEHLPSKVCFPCNQDWLWINQKFVFLWLCSAVLRNKLLHSPLHFSLSTSPVFLSPALLENNDKPSFTPYEKRE